MFKLDHKLCFYNELLSFDLDHCSIEWKGEPHGFYNLKSVFLRHPIPIDPVAYRAFYWFVRERIFGEFLNFTYTDYNKETLLLNFTEDSSVLRARQSFVQMVSPFSQENKIKFTGEAWNTVLAKAHLQQDPSFNSVLRAQQKEPASFALFLPQIATKVSKHKNGTYYTLDTSLEPSDIRFHKHEIRYAERMTYSDKLKFNTYKHVYQWSLYEKRRVKITWKKPRGEPTLENLQQVDCSSSNERHVFEEYFYHLAYECLRQDIADIAVEKDRMIFKFRVPSPVQQQHDYEWPEVQQQQDHEWPAFNIEDYLKDT